MHRIQPSHGTRIHSKLQLMPYSTVRSYCWLALIGCLVGVLWLVGPASGKVLQDENPSLRTMAPPSTQTNTVMYLPYISHIRLPGAVSYPAGSMSVARTGHTATKLQDGRVLIAGGYNNDGYPRETELYNPAAADNPWQKTGSMAQGRYGHTAILLPNGLVLVAGGSGGGDGITTSAELFDPATGRWQATEPMSERREGHTATLLPNGLVLVAGGKGHDGSVASAELYDPATGRWQATGYMVVQRHSHTATLLPNGLVLVTGGWRYFSYIRRTVTSAELYDPSTGRWQLTADPTVGREGHTATLLTNGQVLVAGGAYTATAELYDPATSTWRATGSMASTRAFNAMTLLPDGLVLGIGVSELDGALATAELYEPRTGTWHTTVPPTTRRTFSTVTQLMDGRFLLAGGYAGNTPILPSYTATAEVYELNRIVP